MRADFEGSHRSDDRTESGRRSRIGREMSRTNMLHFPRGSAVIGSMACSAAVVLALLAGCGGPPVVGGGPLHAGAAPADDAVRDAANWLCGNYSSSAQAKTDPNYFDVRLHVARIWTDRADGPWLYVEQAMADAQDKPYRQRIYRLLTLPGNRVESATYELPGNPLTWAGAWRDPARLNAMDPAMCITYPDCSMTLGYDATGCLHGSTSGAGCGNALRGAASASSEMTLSATELRSWDRGFDSAGKQVWGAVKGPYRFVKESPAASGADHLDQPVGDEAAVVAPAKEPQ